MRFMRVLLFVHLTHVFLCHGMERYVDGLVDFADTVLRVAQHLADLMNSKNRLYSEKPAISPLPNFPTELLALIARKLDGKSIENFVLCCSSFDQKLNSSHWLMRSWYHNDRRAPLKIIKEYIAHNEKIIEKYATCTPEQLRTSEFTNLVNHSFTDFGFVRIEKEYWDGVLFTTGSYVTKQTSCRVNNDYKVKLDALYGRRRLVNSSLLHIICANAQYPESVRLLLEQRADLNSPYGGRSIGGAISAFVRSTLFPGNVNRCINIVNILLEYKADIHFKYPRDGDSYLHIVAECSDAHLLLPYFISLGINSNAKNTQGDTPLLCFARQNKELVEKDANFFEKRKFGYLESIRLLMEAKADTTVRNNKNESLFDLLPHQLHQDVQIIIDKKII
jgi:hypothetical protein